MSKNLKTINIKGINLEEVRQLSHILKIKESELYDDSDKVELKGISVKSVSVATVLLYIVLILSTLGFILYRYKHMFLRNNRNPALNSAATDNFALGEGGVMHSSVPRTITVPA